MKQTYETGLAGEKTAEEYLCGKRKMVCLERRYRNKCGEIDLIMLDQDTVVFVEVKTRRNSALGEGLSAVNRTKQTRIARAAMIYLMQKKWIRRPVRFDLIEINRNEILHIPDAFQPGGQFYC